MRAARVSIYLVAVLVVWLYAVVIGRVWCTWLAPKGSPERVRRANWLVRHWSVVMARLTLATFKAELEIRGTVPIGRFLIVSNHQSIADIAIVSAALRNLNVKFVAKEELGRRIPGVSLALREWGSALISRSGSRKDVSRLKAMAEQLEHWNASVVVFPEGTRSRDGRLRPYKPAALRIVAEAAKLPILPVAIDGTHSVADLLGFARNMTGARGTFTIGCPIEPDEWKDRLDEVVGQIRQWTAETIEVGRTAAVLRPEERLADNQVTGRFGPRSLAPVVAKAPPR